jgi:hypothetical protein
VTRRFPASCKNVSPVRILCLLSALITVAGCGDGLASVTGVVTLDGQPIPRGSDVHGTVNFYPENGSGAAAAGMIDESGRYSLRSGSREGIAPGGYLVSVVVNRITLPKTPAGMPQPTLLTPKRYASVTESGLRQEVTSGSNTIDLALTSDKK